MISWKASRVGTDHPPLFPHAFLHAMATVVSAYFSTSAAWCISRMRLRWLNRFRLQGARLGTRVEGDGLPPVFFRVCAAGVSYGYARFEPSTTSYQLICSTRSDIDLRLE